MAHRNHILRIVILTFLSLLVFAAAVQAAPAKVAVLPFQIHADKDYGFLQKGIVDMLSSRLALPGKTEVIDPLTTHQALESSKGLSGDNLALAAGAKLKADHVLHGSITMLGESVSIDAKMLDITGGRPPFTFFKQTQGMNDVINQVNLMANDINAKVFNREAVASGPATSGTAAAPAPTNDQRTHPDKLIQRDQFITGGKTPLEDDATGGASSLNPGFVKPAGSGGKEPVFWKSRNFGYVIMGLAVGDVDKDGKLETVVATPDTLYILRFAQGQMQEVKKIAGARFTTHIAVDIGDINGNGTPEIFVTTMNNVRNQVKSTVYEFVKGEFAPIVTDARWYFRVINHPARGAILLGQRQAMGKEPAGEEIVELEWKSGDYQASARVLPGRRYNVLGLTLGDVMNDKNEAAIGLNADDRLRLAELNGKEVWSSSDYFGGTPSFITMTVSDLGEPANKAYLATRVILADLEQDGKYEAIVARNDEVAGRKLANQRIYNNGQIVALQWNGLGMTEAWYTRKISGHIQDIAIADFDNDGRLEILCGVVLKEGAIIGTEEKSTLVAYKIQK